ncbi:MULTISPECIES: TrbC/VirB2 family protein [Pseudomonas]|uniref:TrbC/VirB2 family protein n=1 Tax=Pseudomonas TaxID=286 RepID=UPI001C715E8B|nr:MULTISPECIES: TrbC/VirB2 family protein [Pseudomonas]URD45735.1 TrbC/VirB2 family protein [Pseudomonas sp. BYT-5]WRW06883.1 TrbC/VirB2 family protein [Pseudomonas putida]
MTVQTTHETLTRPVVNRRLLAFVAAVFGSIFPALAMAANPFTTGATGLSADTLAMLTPVAGIAVMVVGALALFGKIHWMWLIGVIVGIVLLFGSDQIVTWIRGLFGV